MINRLRKDYSVTGIYHENRNNLKYEEVDYFPVTHVDQLPEDYDLVFFVSAYIPDKAGTVYQKMFEVNIDLLARCLKKFKSARFIFASSVSVYGQWSRVRNEQSPYLDVDSYGCSKLWAEGMLKLHHSYAILRISSMYGPGMKLNTFLPLIIKSAVVDKHITLYGDGTRSQNYIHVTDVVELFRKAAVSGKNDVYLVVSKESYTNRQVAEIVKTILPDTNIEFRGLDNSLSTEYNAEVTYQKLDYVPDYSLYAGTKELVEWIKSAD